MARYQVGNPQLMGKMNRATVIHILTKFGPISQTQICHMTGLSRATVSTIISELREEELVVDVSRVASRSGRRRVLLELNGDAGYVIGVDLGGTNGRRCDQPARESGLQPEAAHWVKCWSRSRLPIYWRSSSVWLASLESIKHAFEE